MMSSLASNNYSMVYRITPSPFMILENNWPEFLWVGRLMVEDAWYVYATTLLFPFETFNIEHTAALSLGLQK